MKKTVLTLVFPIALAVVLIAPADASVFVESTIGDSVYVICSFENLDTNIYNEAIANPQFNSTTIPQIIVENLEKQGISNVYYGFQPNTNDDETKTIRVSFYLSGSDIISFTINRTTMQRTYQVKTEWRKFQVNLTSNFSINFAQYFAEPLANWQKTNLTTEGSTHTAFSFETTDAGFLDTLSFSFILPATATDVQVEGDTITYEVSPYFEDVFINSPFLILAALIIIIAVALVYRRVR